MSVFDTIPPQGPAKPGQLRSEELQHFFDKGYVLLNDVFTDADLVPMKAEIDEIVDEIANRLYDAGKITDKAEKAPHEERLARLDEQFPGAAVLVYRKGVTGPVLNKIWTNPRLLNIMEQLVGPDIIDNGYMDSSVDSVLQVTAWIPLLDTNPTNGGLEILPGAHKANKVADHEGVWGNTWFLFMPDSKQLGVPLDEAINVDVPYGSVLLFNNLIPHRSLPNLSKTIRWSLDLRWQNGNEPIGWHGVKGGVWFRKGGEDVKPDWETFNASDHLSDPNNKPATIEDEVLISPYDWLKRWKLTRRNKYSEGNKPRAQNEESKLWE